MKFKGEGAHILQPTINSHHCELLHRTQLCMAERNCLQLLQYALYVFECYKLQPKHYQVESKI